MEVWSYLENGGRHAELIWHRRSGKDEVALHRTAVAAFERVANYWHMLPLATQVRKAIWEAVNPHTGKRRIDEAFPVELRSSTRDHEMMIRFKNGSTWQALGSDNYESAIGSAPAGIVYSEWAQANPTARGFLRPILTENNGWQIYITTPRGKNHAKRTFEAAGRTEGVFAQKLTIDQTGVLSQQQLKTELTEYIDTYGIDMGTALYEQEYYCSFDAAILGAIWGAELSKLEKDGRYTLVPHDKEYPVSVALDIGKKDQTAVWFYQVIANQVRVIDYFADSLKDVDYYVSMISGVETIIDIIDSDIKITTKGKQPGAEHRTEYRIEKIHLPHDAKAKRLGSKKSVQEQFCAAFGWGVVSVLRLLSVDDGLKFVRQMLRRTWISTKCSEGWEALKSYRYEYNERLKKHKNIPLHDWASDPADGFRYLATAVESPRVMKEESNPNKRDAYGCDDDESNWKGN